MIERLNSRNSDRSEKFYINDNEYLWIGKMDSLDGKHSLFAFFRQSNSNPSSRQIWQRNKWEDYTFLPGHEMYTFKEEIKDVPAQAQQAAV